MHTSSEIAQGIIEIQLSVVVKFQTAARFYKLKGLVSLIFYFY